MRILGTDGPKIYTQAQATQLLQDYQIKLGTVIRVSDVGEAPGQLYVFDGNGWILENGAKGEPGLNGNDGREVEFQIIDEYLAWRYVGSSTWENLISVSEITGPNGINGKNVELQSSDTHIQWRIQGEQAWNDLIELSALKGDKGDAGNDASIDPIDNLFCVAKNGNDTSGNGSISKPFLTIARALQKASELPSGVTALIDVLPGTYEEDVTVTRPRTVIQGHNGAASATQVVGSIQFLPASVEGSTYNSIFALDDLMIVHPSTNSNDALSFSGDKQGYIRLRNVKIVSANPSKIGLSITSTASVRSNIYLENVDIKAAGRGFAISNFNGFSRGYFALESTDNEAFNLTNANFTVNPGGVIVSGVSGRTITIDTGARLFISSSSVTNNSPAENNADILYLASTANLRLANVDFFSIDSEGFVLNGEAGASIEYGTVRFFGNRRAKFSLTYSNTSSNFNLV